MSYQTHGDPYADPPRARICLTCGALVGDEALHDRWHHDQLEGEDS